jgi:hypothetical protein
MNISKGQVCKLLTDVEKTLTSKYKTALRHSLNGYWVNTFSLDKLNPYNNVDKERRPRGISSFCHNILCTWMKKISRKNLLVEFIQAWSSVCAKDSMLMSDAAEPAWEKYVFECL